ncbi:ELWxxDGT repeat protein [Pontibacter aydingkolensis]|uniref:T9SS type A sorting domain-containing protein n=1 Tax=Pontibacter aydingkolensis TaxID=1911536 RepID=A0ABS7CWA2_9BACT|nr:ELWxxDGT repeat protein [Pontibacter aydingkolensis]MBW7468107.1 T9SS type A sorting domain-containing protein [Pontibacter aydingkolensis]
MSHNNQDTKLWSSSGDAASTINYASAGSGYGDYFTGVAGNFYDKLYFWTGAYSTSNKLWVTDGSSEGTKVIKIFEFGPSNIGQTVAFKNKLYFFMNGYTTEAGLWYTDGTTSGTSRLKYLAGSSQKHNIKVSGNYLYFSACTSEAGCELWRTDGTPEGTIQLKDIYPGEQSSSPQWLTDVNGTLYFTVAPPYPQTNYGSLWKTDGTPEGTVKVKQLDLNGGFSGMYNLVAYQNRLYFTIRNGNWPGNSYDDLWTTDGAATGTTVLETLPMGLSSVANMQVVQDALLFFVQGELWKSSGTPGSTARISAINPPTYTYPGQQSATSMFMCKGKLHFNAYSQLYGNELWNYTNNIPTSEAATVKISSTSPHTFSEDSFPFYDEDSYDRLTKVKIHTLPEEGSLTFKGMAVTAGQEIFVTELNKLVYTPSENSTTITGFTFDVSDGLDSSNGRYPLNFKAENLTSTKKDHKQELILYPNPTATTLHLSSTLASFTLIRIYNLLGQVVQEQALKPTAHYAFDVSKLASGAYILEVETSKSQLRKKFIKR